MKYNNKADKLPFKFILFFVSFTLILFLIGPVSYPEIDSIFILIMILYIILFLIISRFGFYMGNKAKVIVKYSKRNHKFKSLIKFSLFFVLFIKVLLLIQSIASQGLPEFTSVYSLLANSYTNLYQSDSNQIFIRQIDTFFTFLSYVALFTIFYDFKIYETRYKFLAILIVLIDVIYNALFLGTSRTLVTYFIVIILAYLVNSFRKGKNLYNRKTIIKSIVFLVLIVVFLGNIIVSRKFLWGYDYLSVSLRSGAFYDYSNIFVRYLPNNLKYLVSNITYYVSHGYYGFALSFDTPMEWTYGLGSYRGINSILSQLFPAIPNLTNYSLPVRAGTLHSFDGLANWYTIFPWLISDFGYVGTLIYMFFVAYIYQKTWKQTVYYNNPLAFSLFSLITIQYLFLTANNQLFIRRGESVATIIIFIAWLFMGNRFNKKREGVRNV